MRYDPARGPDLEEWLAAAEGERLQAVQDYHERAGIRLPRVRAHAVFHVAAENQLAEGYPGAVRALARLTAGGVDRHQAIHAIGSVLLRHMQAMMKGRAVSFDEQAYARELEALDAGRWRPDSPGSA